MRGYKNLLRVRAAEDFYKAPIKNILFFIGAFLLARI
jgi:hypothetical protein